MNFEIFHLKSFIDKNLGEKGSNENTCTRTIGRVEFKFNYK